MVGWRAYLLAGVAPICMGAPNDEDNNNIVIIIFAVVDSRGAWG